MAEICQIFLLVKKKSEIIWPLKKKEKKQSENEKNLNLTEKKKKNFLSKAPIEKFHSTVLFV